MKILQDKLLFDGIIEYKIKGDKWKKLTHVSLIENTVEYKITFPSKKVQYINGEFLGRVCIYSQQEKKNLSQSEYAIGRRLVFNEQVDKYKTDDKIKDIHDLYRIKNDLINSREYSDCDNHYTIDGLVIGDIQKTHKIDVVCNKQFKNLKENLKELKSILESRANTLQIFEGISGTGKSSSVAKIIEERYSLSKIAVFSLTNLKGIQFKNLIMNEEIVCNQYSNTKARHHLIMCNSECITDKRRARFSGIIDNDVLVFEAFENWGLYEVELLLDLLKANPKAHLFFISDKNAMQTFLSIGSLSYSLQSMLKDRVTYFKESGRLIGDTEMKNKLNKLVSGSFDYDIMMLDEVEFDDSSVIIATSKESIDFCNLKMIYKNIFENNSHYANWFQFYNKFKYSKGDDSHKTLYRKTQLLKELPVNSKLIMTNNVKENSAEYNYISLTKETHDFVTIVESTKGRRGTRHVENRITLSIDNEESMRELFKKYAFGYSVSIYDAKREYESVILYLTESDVNKGNRHLLYSALSKASLTAVVTSAKLFKEKDFNEEELKQEISGMVKPHYIQTSLFDFEFISKMKKRVYYLFPACIKRFKLKNGSWIERVVYAYQDEYTETTKFKESKDYFNNLYSDLPYRELLKNNFCMKGVEDTLIWSKGNQTFSKRVIDRDSLEEETEHEKGLLHFDLNLEVPYKHARVFNNSRVTDLKNVKFLRAFKPSKDAQEIL